MCPLMCYKQDAQLLILGKSGWSVTIAAHSTKVLRYVLVCIIFEEFSDLISFHY